MKAGNPSGGKVERRTRGKGIGMEVSICIPTKNGGEQFRQVLEAVFHQKTDRSYEVICVDSGSSDGTLEIIRSFPEVTLRQIPPEEFGHGKTRNLAASFGTGTYILFLTQDAVPASDSWLEQMIRAMETDERIAVGFGIHYPYPDCNVLDRRDILNHFQGFGRTNTVYRLDDPGRYEQDAEYREKLAFSSDNNACVRRDVFTRYPYPDVEFAEDQIWTRQMMERGYSKVYCPYAAVYHSHNYPPREYARRYFDQYKGIQELRGGKVIDGVSAAVREAKQQIRLDIAYVRQQPLNYSQKFRWAKYVVHRDLARYRAAWRAGRYPDRSPAGRDRMDRKYSQQYGQRRGAGGKASTMVWNYRDLWDYGRELALATTDQGQTAHVEEEYGFVLNTEEIPFCRADFEAHRDDPNLIVNWVIPEPAKGSGGHTTIFRFVSALQRRGIRNRIYILEPKLIRSDREAAVFLHENFPLLDEGVEIRCGCGRMEFCHAAVATSWVTAYYVRRFMNTVSKFYFVQDYEPFFYPVGSESKFAENTYRFGFRGITAGDWLKTKLEREFSMACDSFHFSCDPEIYRVKEKRDAVRRVFFYARPSTARRAWELGLLALIRLKEKMPEVEIVFAGGDVSRYHIPFSYRSAGVARPEELAELYSQSDISLVMSITNLSLLPLEIMACGGVVATQDDENNAWLINGENAIIIDCDPVHIADALADGLAHPEKLGALRENGIRLARGTDWETEAEKVYRSMVRGVAEDTESRRTE
ncbi:MAG: glycosyltransferase [Clostridia bacterium]|nr:glycosyltransferase [Clostridia bacterium]